MQNQFYQSIIEGVFQEVCQQRMELNSFQDTDFVEKPGSDPGGRSLKIS